MHGYELHQTLQREFGLVWHISQSQAYNILNRLVRSELLVTERQPSEGSPEKHLLQLTDAGFAHFENWLITPTSPGTQPIRTEFITRLVFARRNFPHLEESIITAQLSTVKERLLQLEEQLESLPPDCDANRLALQLRIRSLNNIGIWLNELSVQPCSKE